MSVVIRPDLSPLQKVYYKIKSVIAPERKPDVIYDISRGVAYAPGTKTAERIEKTPPTERFDPYKVDEGEIRLKGKNSRILSSRITGVCFYKTRTPIWNSNNHKNANSRRN